MSGSPELSVILPTYNERASLPLLAPRLEKALEGIDHEVVVVDDASPDKTGELVRQMAQTAPYRLCNRESARGLASAVVDGFDFANGDLLVVMDADGSHPPESVGSLLAPIRCGTAEMALGVRRFDPGGPASMTRRRRAVSAIASLMARPLTSVEDPMSGFFALDRRILRRSPLEPLGYKVALEILVKCRPTPLAQVPYVFAPRIAGESKLNRREIGGYVRHLARLYRWQAAHRDGLPGPESPHPARESSPHPPTAR